MSEVSKNYAELMRGDLKVRDEIVTKGECDIHRVIGSLISNKEVWAIPPEERPVGRRRSYKICYKDSVEDVCYGVYRGTKEIVS